MRIRRPIAVLIAAQIVGALLSLFFFRQVWPGPPYGFVQRLFHAGTPALIWIVPFLVYAAGEAVGREVHGRVVRIIWAFLGSFGIAVAYEFALYLLHQWELARFQADIDRCIRSAAEVCPSAYPMMDPPPPPLHWEWAAAGSILLLIGLYAILYAGRGRANSAASSSPVTGGEHKKP